MGKYFLRTLTYSMCLLLLPFTQLYAENSLLLEKDGITVEQDVLEGRVLPILTGKVTLDANVELIVSWLSAVHTYVDWQFNCKEARLIESLSEDILTYNRVASPWPVSDRDVILKSTRKNLANGSVHLEFRSVDETNMKIPRGVVRMVHLFGSYLLTPSTDGRTQIVYTLDSDPGGSLPLWLVKRASKDLPYETLKALRNKIKTGPPPEA